MHQNMNRQSSKILIEKQIPNPQVSIYNRNFYLRAAEHNLRQEQHDTEVRQLANRPKITAASYQILCEQLEDRLVRGLIKASTTHVKMNNHQEISQHLDMIWVDFESLQTIIQQDFAFSPSSDRDLEHFLSQIWLALGQYAILPEIKANLIYSTLRIFMDPYNLSDAEYLEMLTHIDQFRNMEQNRAKFLKEYPHLVEETLTIDMIIRLWKKIRYENPSFAKNIDRFRTPGPSEFAFKPIINKKSQYLAEKSMKKYMSSHEAALNKTLEPSKFRSDENELSRYLDNIESYDGDSKLSNKPSCHDILYQRRLEKDEIQARVPKEDTFETCRNSRTARPDEIKEIVNNLYVVKEKKEDTNFAQKDEENELKLCTFSPKINKNYYSTRRSVSPAIKGYQKQISRVQKGREEKQRKKQAYQNLGRPKNTGKSPNQKTAPSFIDREAPKLILEINIDGGERVEKLPLKGNENPHLVAKKFVIKHGLEEQMITVLQQLVKEQLEQL